MFEKILIAVDSTKSRFSVFDKGYEIAKVCGAKAILFHLIEISTHIADLNPDIEKMGYERGKMLVEDLKARASDPGVVRETVIKEGENPSVEILNVAKKFDVDLIVVGRKTGIEASMMHHSIDRFLIEHSKIPLLII